MKKLCVFLSLAVSMGFASTRIGVLKKKTNQSCDEEVSITLDVEDSKNKTKYTVSYDSGFMGPSAQPAGIAISEGRGRVTFTYCVLNVDQLPKLFYDYAVLRLDSSCPSGAQRFRRHHDSEDSNNRNSYTGNIWPSVVTKNADLEYCFVPADSSTNNYYPFNDGWESYSFFAKDAPAKVKTVGGAYSAGGELFVDDENSNNANSWYWYGASENIQNRIKKIIGGSRDTQYNVVSWNIVHVIMGTNQNVLAKNGDVENSNSIVVSADVSLSPVIKGLDRSAVAVELKSAGNAKVSIINANGAVVADIAQEDLQPGVHLVKWNSGIVPNGRYIVKIEQNGMVSAKNVILK